LRDAGGDETQGGEPGDPRHAGHDIGQRLQVENEPPYYASSSSPVRGLRLAHTPVLYQRGSAQPAFFDPAAGAGTPVARLLDEMSSYLDALGASTPLSAAPRGTPPDVRFDCESDALDECSPELGGRREGPSMRLAVGRPSREWVTALAAALAESDADAALVLTLEVGRYWPRQKNFRGDKVVELGTGHTVALPWLTALDKPVQALQITGALVGPDGRALRIGAEGLLAVHTNLFIGALGIEQLISDADVERVLREPLGEGQDGPLVWQAAIRALVSELTARRELALR
jgi:hypothetical protein